MKKKVSSVLAAALLAGGIASFAPSAERAPAFPAECEPGTTLDLRARIVDIVDRGDSARVTVEVILDAAIDIRSARIRGQGINRLIAVPDDRSSRRADGTLVGLRQTGRRAPGRVTRYPVDLESGKIHQLRFEAEVETPDGDSLTARASVTVNLDPDRQPRHLPGLVEYRARSSR